MKQESDGAGTIVVHRKTLSWSPPFKMRRTPLLGQGRGIHQIKQFGQGCTREGHVAPGMAGGAGRIWRRARPKLGGETRAGDVRDHLKPAARIRCRAVRTLPCMTTPMRRGRLRPKQMLRGSDMLWSLSDTMLRPSPVPICPYTLLQLHGPLFTCLGKEVLLQRSPCKVVFTLQQASAKKP